MFPYDFNTMRKDELLAWIDYYQYKIDRQTDRIEFLEDKNRTLYRRLSEERKNAKRP